MRSSETFGCNPYRGMTLKLHPRCWGKYTWDKHCRSKKVHHVFLRHSNRHHLGCVLKCVALLHIFCPMFLVSTQCVNLPSCLCNMAQKQRIAYGISSQNASNGSATGYLQRGPPGAPWAGTTYQPGGGVGVGGFRLCCDRFRLCSPASSLVCWLAYVPLFAFRRLVLQS